LVVVARTLGRVVYAIERDWLADELDLEEVLQHVDLDHQAPRRN
jgi:hypothetical protein